MSRRPFFSFRDEMVERFRREIKDAWADARLPERREDAVPHVCWECDKVWNYLQEINMESGIAMDGQMEWAIPTSLMTPQAIAFFLGPWLLMCTYAEGGDPFGVLELTFGGEDERKIRRRREVLANLSDLQKRCVLKMLIWLHLEYGIPGIWSVEYEFQSTSGISNVRRALGLSQNWQWPRRRAQT